MRLGRSTNIPGPMTAPNQQSTGWLARADADENLTQSRKDR